MFLSDNSICLLNYILSVAFEFFLWVPQEQGTGKSDQDPDNSTLLKYWKHWKTVILMIVQERTGPQIAMFRKALFKWYFWKDNIYAFVLWLM